MSALRKFVAPEFIFGSGALRKCSDYALTFGASKVLVVTDPGLVKAGWTGKVEAQLKEAGLPFERFDAVSPNPRDSEVMEGAEFYRNNHCDMIIAVGGGSPMDCAKGIGVVATNGGHVLDYEGVDQVPVPMPPLLCIPTTAGTAADVSQFAIILDSENSNKIAIISKGVVPDVSLIDPETACTMDAQLSAATGMDALTHAVEAYVSNAAGPITDLHALEAIRYLVANLETTIARPDDITTRAGTMMGSLMAGLAFSNASLGLVHAMAHALGGLLDLPHGLCNALLLEHVIAYNHDAVPGRYRQVWAAMSRGQGQGTAIPIITPRNKGASLNSTDALSGLLELLVGMRHRLGLGDRLTSKPVSEQTIGKLADRALRDPCLATNPKKAGKADIAGIYKALLTHG
ncbi:MAG: alcohol dehydrogenase-like regulatory protein ErcA [Spirochaetota bacterium]